MFKNNQAQNIRPMAVAGQFYPANKAVLENILKSNLQAAPPVKVAGQVKIIIVPHAGYDYSAGIAALAYKALVGQKIRRVYLLGNSHHDYFTGVAADGHEFWQTPLGRVPVDVGKIKELIATSSLIKINNSPHQAEHGLEVQVPFLQTVLNSDFKIVPLLLGNAQADDYESLAKILAANLENGDLIVVSSDMSHYPSYEVANKIDHQTLELIKAKNLIALDQAASQALSAQTNEQTILCGLEAVKTALYLAQKFNLKPQILGYKNSGDTLGADKTQVVGYGAIIFTTPNLTASNLNSATTSDLSLAQQKILLEIAKTSVETYVKNKKIPKFEINDDGLKKIQGAFVTLKKGGELRGCIGQIIANSPLWQVVRDMAIAAATEDDRFQPVQADELKQLEYEISVLSVPRPLSDWHRIRSGVDGVIIKKGLRSGVFLPQVATETGWTKDKFLSALCWQKVGLPPDCYKNDPEVKISVFQAQVF